MDGRRTRGDHPTHRHAVSATPASRGTPFRLASDTRTGSDLEGLLRGRLRIASALATFTAAGLGTATLISNLPQIERNIWAAFTIPPFGVPLLFMAVGMAGMWHSLRQHGLNTLPRLRRLTWILLGSWAAFFVFIIQGDLRLLLDQLPTVPIDLAMAHSSMWGLLLLIGGVLFPSTPREGMLRNTVLLLCTFLPDLIVFQGLDAMPEKSLVYLGTKTVMVVFYASFATYGGYRIETLRRDAQAARQLGQYLLTTPLGAGGMGEVYRAEHRMLRRPCAVKLIRPEQAGDEATLQRFEREAQATAALTHPSTVQVFDYGIAEDGTFYYVMEFLDGMTLEELLHREGAQPAERVVPILLQLCGALQEAHQAGLVHRDIKPGNIMLGDRGGVRDVAKLLDFGLVGVVRAVEGESRSDPGGDDAGELTLAGSLVGTPSYMSPEQCLGHELGPASDLYSLGAVAFTLLTGEAPFAGRAQLQLLFAHVQEIPRRADIVNPDIPGRLADVIVRCMSKAPADRYADGLALAEALKQATAA